MQTWEIATLAVTIPVAAVLGLYCSFRAYRMLTATKHKLVPKLFSKLKPSAFACEDEGGQVRVDPAVDDELDVLSLCQKVIPHFSSSSSSSKITHTDQLTMWALFRNACEGPFAKLPLHGTYSQEKKDFVYETYESVLQDVLIMAQGLEELELITNLTEQEQGEGGVERVFALFGPNSSTWVKLEHAAMSQSATIVPLYTTLTQEGIQHVLRLTQVQSVACLTEELANKMISAATNAQLPLRSVIVMHKTDALVKLCEDNKIQLVTVQQVRDAGKETSDKSPHDARPPTSSTVWTFCFTSGSTGAPKAAMITHLSICSNTAAMVEKFVLQEVGNGHYLSYLPQAHQLERSMAGLMVCFGSRIAFFRGDLATLMDDIKLVRPTFFPSVPRLLNRIALGLEGKIAQAKPTVQRLFAYAVKSKLYDLHHYGHATHPIWDKIVFNKITKQLGLDRCVAIGSGSAPIAIDTLNFLRVVLGFCVSEAYGQTEQTCSITAAHPYDVGNGTERASHVGGPIRLNEVRLESVPEMKYLIQDRLHDGQPVVGRGEILTRGPAVMKGYYKQPEKTADAIDRDGWLHTGDIGAWTVDGKLQIIDRKSNIFKTSVGEYVQLDKIERAVCSCQSVVQSCLVFGTTLNSKLVCVVVVNEGVDIDSNKQGLDTQIAQTCRQFGLLGYEVPGAFRFKKEPFTVESGVLTATAKIVRSVAKQFYRDDLVSMYEELGEEVKI